MSSFVDRALNSEARESVIMGRKSMRRAREELLTKGIPHGVMAAPQNEKLKIHSTPHRDVVKLGKEAERPLRSWTIKSTDSFSTWVRDE